MSSAWEQGNGRASGPVLQSVFLAVLEHSVSLLHRISRASFSPPDLLPCCFFVCLSVSLSVTPVNQLSWTRTWTSIVINQLTWSFPLVIPISLPLSFPCYSNLAFLCPSVRFLLSNESTSDQLQQQQQRQKLRIKIKRKQVTTKYSHLMHPVVIKLSPLFLVE